MKQNRILSLAAPFVFMIGASGASLDLPNGDFPIFTTTTTSVTDAVSGITFDVAYTATASATDSPRVVGNGSSFGVGSTPDGTTPLQLRSIDGGDGESLSFTGLTVSNISDAAFDVTNLVFTGISVVDSDNVNDGFDIVGDAGSENFTSPADGPVTFASSTTAFTITPDTAAGTNRFALTGLEVSFDVVPVVVPEPTSAALLGLGGLALVARRKRA